MSEMIMLLCIFCQFFNTEMRPKYEKKKFGYLQNATNEYGRTCGAENNHQHDHIKKFTEYECEVVLVHLIVKFCEE